MRTNIEIDDELMATAMKAGPYQTKKDAVEAGLQLLARQVSYREILKWRGKLKWEGDDSIDWAQGQTVDPAVSQFMVAESVPEGSTRPQRALSKTTSKSPKQAAKRHAGR